MMKILVIDNYDSFTYNLVHYLEQLTDAPVTVKRNDKLTLKEAVQFDKILLSPGPGIPDEAGLSKAIIKEYAHEKSILGICLGHQAIAEVFGAELFNLSTVYHGVSTNIILEKPDDYLFKGIPKNFEAGRYHSWIVKQEGLPESLEVTARDDNKVIMGLSHKQYDVKGLQFHPESVLTAPGLKIIENWINQICHP